MSTLPSSIKGGETADQKLTARGSEEAHLKSVEAHKDLRKEARATHGLTHVRGDGAHTQDPAWRTLTEEVPLVDTRGVLFARHLEVPRAHVTDGEFLDGGFVAPDENRLISGIEIRRVRCTHSATALFILA